MNDILEMKILPLVEREREEREGINVWDGEIGGSQLD